MFANNNQSYNNGYQQPQQYGGYPQQQPQQPAGKLESLDDLLNGSGAKSYFNGDSQPGATITGTLDLIETSQIRDFQTKQPSYWNDGRPQMQIHIVIQTNQRDPSVDDDDGRRSIWIKGWGIQLKAFREACQKAGIKKPGKGDQFTATFTGYGERGNAPQPPKVYEYQIQHHDGVDALLGQQPPVGNFTQQAPRSFQQSPAAAPYQQPPVGSIAQQVPQTYQQPAQYAQQPPVQQTPPAAAPAPQVNIMQLQQLQAAGKSMTEIAGLTGLSEPQVQQILQPAANEEQPEF
ncbi:MAG: hypothetical protein ABF780_05775 [Bifidobacterium aquikefiri]|uniref:Uncharacterized protein n=1 Tax=Bifidobacterium aquikefiri TaxID=1653207 RepID=A0A261G262_9BIFI|nr:hypothetical protein [Bifidobacterium aquikefiri]OZG65529.1 hypothetical protein BAQU_1712 [Bifidobacterium aquikefiri]